jgi:hypothetical protein
MKPQVSDADCWAQRDAYPWTERDEVREAVDDFAGQRPHHEAGRMDRATVTVETGPRRAVRGVREAARWEKGYTGLEGALLRVLPILPAPTRPAT